MTTPAAQRKLDPTQDSTMSKLLVQQFSNKIVGQKKATQILVDIFESHRAGFSDDSHPAGNALFLGPTGTGKTHVAETFAEALFGNKKACVRIDCAEFQHSHEISKLIGSPPGYLGHRETAPALTQEVLNKYHTDSLKLSIVLFDEIEKASDSLWSLMLGILDNAKLTLGDNKVVDFSNVIIIMTSNLGAREMANRGIGFVEPTDDLDNERLEKIAMSAARSKFSPEFMNRIQNFVTFRTLTTEQIEAILEIELRELAYRLFAASSPLTEAHLASGASRIPRFTLAISPKAKRTMITEGYDKKYGARHLKRTVDRRIQHPLAKLVTSGQLNDDDIVVVTDSDGTVFDFHVHNPKETQ